MIFHLFASRLTPICAAVIGSTALLAPSYSQAAPDATRPTAPAVNWWDNNAAPAQQPAMQDRRVPERDDFRGFPRQAAVGNGGVTDYPSAQLSDWVVANAMAARARALLIRAESDLNTTVRRVQARFEHSQEFADAAFAQKQAYSEYTVARQRVLATLANNPKYHAISLLRDELGEKIAARRTSRDVTHEELMALATLKMQYASDARVVEIAAIDADTDLKNARDKMVEASRRVLDMRARFDDALHDNPELLVARRNLEDARIGVVEASTLAQGASIASAYAINYSYYLHRNDNGGIYGPYGANGVYGNGYSSPYWGR